jgi:hypothetical protein
MRPRLRPSWETNGGGIKPRSRLPVESVGHPHIEKAVTELFIQIPQQTEIASLHQQGGSRNDARLAGLLQQSHSVIKLFVTSSHSGQPRHNTPHHRNDCRGCLTSKQLLLLGRYQARRWCARL